MNCHLCGKELSGGVDTFGPAGFEICRGCWLNPVVDEQVLKDFDRLEEAIGKARVVEDGLTDLYMTTDSNIQSRLIERDMKMVQDELTSAIEAIQALLAEHPEIQFRRLMWPGLDVVKIW